MASDSHRDFVEAVNEHRHLHVKRSDSIYVNGIMRRWHRIGGKLAQKGISHCCTLERKPENEHEIRIAACGES